MDDNKIDEMRKDGADKERTAAGENKKYMSLLETAQSVLWAMLGVQNKKNANRDFSRGKPSHFIIIGLLFAGVFVLTLVTIVKSILGQVAS